MRKLKNMQQEQIKKYIRGEASLAQKKEILEWTKVDKENLSQLLALRRLHDIAIWQQEAYESGMEHKAKFQHGIFMNFYKLTSIAATLAILLAMAFYTYQMKQQVPEIAMQKISVPAGQRAELILADGSHVWLNAGSTLSFPSVFLEDSRKVSLDGEAYFTVEKNEKKPFIVTTSSFDIEVLGTEFNVLAYSKSPIFDVSLIKGGVEVYDGNKNEKIKLEPQTRAYLLDHKLTKATIADYNNFLWKDGLICFNDEAIVDIASKLELYYDVKIIIENKSFMNQKYTGKFRTKDGIEHILKVFQRKDKFSYEKDDESNIITIQ